MRILHVGIGASSARNADFFFQGLLGLEKAVPVTLAAELCQGVFAIQRELVVIHYRAAGIDLEVFIDPSYRAPEPTVLHACLEVDDQARFLEQCGAAGLRVSRTPKGEGFVSFVHDLDGNLFEIKQKK
jgi:catechol 2,3-dioxygenase-like lactoylglutathione lyase family enzyme